MLKQGHDPMGKDRSSHSAQEERSSMPLPKSSYFYEAPAQRFYNIINCVYELRIGAALVGPFVTFQFTRLGRESVKIRNDGTCAKMDKKASEERSQNL